MCCGQKRSALRATLGPAAPPATSRRPANHSLAGAYIKAGQTAQLPAGPWRTAATIQALHAPVNLRYLQNSAVRLRGSVTGREYDFSASHPAQSVDRRDAAGLLKTGLFRQV